MNSEKLTRIINLANKFRAALEKRKSDLPVNFWNFPRGSCGDTSLFLGKYLKENGFGPIDYVAGMRGTQSHAWLELNSFIIDITADQFCEGLDPVVVTRNRSWHNHFIENTRHEADFIYNDDTTNRRLLSEYNKIISQLEY
jgi:hypothetical protein